MYHVTNWVLRPRRFSTAPRKGGHRPHESKGAEVRRILDSCVILASRDRPQRVAYLCFKAKSQCTGVVLRAFLLFAGLHGRAICWGDGYLDDFSDGVEGLRYASAYEKRSAGTAVAATHAKVAHDCCSRHVQRGVHESAEAVPSGHDESSTIRFKKGGGCLQRHAQKFRHPLVEVHSNSALGWRVVEGAQQRVASCTSRCKALCPCFRVGLSGLSV